LYLRATLAQLALSIAKTAEHAGAGEASWLAAHRISAFT